MSEEIWKDIPGYEGYYEVSDRGRVRSLDRVVETVRGPRKVQGKIRTLSLRKDGYLHVGFQLQGRREFLLVHRLVLAAFEGPCPDGHETGHRDGNRTNNSLLNLRYITSSENNHEITKHGNRKLSHAQIRDIRERVAAGETLMALAPEFNVAFSTIGRVASRKQYASVPDHP